MVGFVKEFKYWQDSESGQNCTVLQWLIYWFMGYLCSAARSSMYILQKELHSSFSVPKNNKALDFIPITTTIKPSLKNTPHPKNNNNPKPSQNSTSQLLVDTTPVHGTETNWKCTFKKYFKCRQCPSFALLEISHFLLPEASLKNDTSTKITRHCQVKFILSLGAILQPVYGTGTKYESVS